MLKPRGRGRPPKNKNPDAEDVKYVKISTKTFSQLKTQGIELEGFEPGIYQTQKQKGEAVIKQKRKYTRRKPVVYNKLDDNTIIKPETKKRGRKRGRKSKDQEVVFKPHEILDYIHRNYPLMGINRIREKVIDGLKLMRDLEEGAYILTKFTYDGSSYYFDDNNAILNTDGKLIGLFISQTDGNNKMYLFNRKDKDIRTFKEVIDDIENKK